MTEPYILSTLLAFPEEVAGISLRSEDFTYQPHSLVFEAMTEMAAKGAGIDPMTLVDHLEASGRLGLVGGVDFIREISEVVPVSAVLLPEHARIIREASMRRQMRDRLLVALDALANPMKSVVEVAGMVEAAAMAGVETSQGKDLRHAKTYLHEVYEIIERQSKGEITGLKTGFIDLDSHMSGMQKSDLIILGGRPRMGKTALATDIAGHVAIDQGKSVAFFELEMSARQIVERSLLARAKVNGQLLRSGKLPQRDYPRLAIANGPIAGSGWYLDDSVGLTPLQMMAKCRKHRYKHGLDLVVVDNIQKMRGDGKYGGNKRLEIADITNSLKNMAKDLDVPIIAISHLSRGPDQRPDHEPCLSDLQESGNIEQDADIVMLLYREEVYTDVAEDLRGFSKVIFAKYRNGQEGFKPLHFNEEFSSFSNWAGARETQQNGGEHEDFYGNKK